MHFTGIIIAICTFLTIGIWHPIVIKTEYYWGTRPWIIYLIIGLAAIVAALFIDNTLISSVVGVFGASALWGIGELFEQKKRIPNGNSYLQYLLDIRLALAFEVSESFPFRYCSMTSPAMGAARSAPNPPCST